MNRQMEMWCDSIEGVLASNRIRGRVPSIELQIDGASLWVVGVAAETLKRYAGEIALALGVDEVMIWPDLGGCKVVFLPAPPHNITTLPR